MAWRAALEGVPWHTVFRRFGIVLAAAQVVNAVRGVGVTRALRRKLRRARRASAKRKRAAEARKAQKQAEKRAEAQRARAEADAKSARERTRAAASSARSSRDDRTDPEPNRFGVAHSRDGPRDSTWLKGEYEENVPVHVEREIAAAALDEVAMALAAEGDADASAAVAGMALRVAAAESPKKIRLEALANLSNTLSTNLGSNALVRATDRQEASGSESASRSVAADRAAAGERASPGGVSASTTTTPFSFRSDSNRGSSAGPRSFAVSVSSSDRSAESSARGRSRDGSPSHESFAASAFEMAARAAAMGDDPEGLTSDEEAEEVELAERRRAAAAAAAAAAEAERMQAANEAALAAAAAAGATAARRASFDEWAAASRSSRDVEAFLSADDDASASVSSYHGSLDDYSSDSGSDVSDVQAASGAASAWLAKTRERMRLSPTRERGAASLFGRRRGAEPPRDAEARAREADGGEDFLFHRVGTRAVERKSFLGRDVAPARSRDESPIRREVERRARALSSSESEDDEASPPREKNALRVPRRTKPSAPPTLRLEVLSGVSRGDAVSAPPGVEFLTVGRGDARDLCVGDVEVSSSHAEFRWTWFASFRGNDDEDEKTDELPDALFGADDAGRARLGEWRVADVGSTNGTFVNGEPVGGGGSHRLKRAWRALRHGDEIRLGERAESPALRVSLLEADSHDAPPSLRADSGGFSFSSKEKALLLRSSVRVDPGKPPRMEDRALAECPLRGCADVALFAVFDGHAGADAAEKARRFFPEILARRLGRCAPAAPSGPDGPPGDAASALRDAFVETDQAIECEYEGCSIAALLVWRCETTGGVYAQTANVGDAEICVGRARATFFSRGDDRSYEESQSSYDYDASRVSARVLTRPHLIADPSERARFVAAGASVEPGAREVRGLRVSRAVGDFFLKRELPGLVATPYVSAPIRVRGDGCDVAVLATRGLWRVVDETEATSLATSSREEKEWRRRDERGSPSSRRWSPAAGAARLVELARRRRSREDVAVVVVRLEEAMGGGGSAA